jgi:hypothetical protein
MIRSSGAMIAAPIFALAIGCAAAQAAPPEEKTPPDAMAPKTDLQSKKGDLSNKLDKDNGVVRPQGAVDPGMEKKPPSSAGDTPVIKPPTDDSNVQPK